MDRRGPEVRPRPGDPPPTGCLRPEWDEGIQRQLSGVRQRVEPGPQVRVWGARTRTGRDSWPPQAPTGAGRPPAPGHAPRGPGPPAAAPGVRPPQAAERGPGPAAPLRAEVGGWGPTPTSPAAPQAAGEARGPQPGPRPAPYRPRGLPQVPLPGPRVGAGGGGAAPSARRSPALGPRVPQPPLPGAPGAAPTARSLRPGTPRRPGRPSERLPPADDPGAQGPPPPR